eukprot:2740709-Ditylum_brightwellii.AAC.1
MSWLGENVHIDPSLKQYLVFARKIYTENTPDKGEVNKDNLPGRWCKKHKTETAFPTTVNLAHINTDKETMIPIIHDPNKRAKKEVHWKNTPIAFMTTKTVQKGTTRHFSYIRKTAASMTRIPWVLCKPKFGHFIQATGQIA